MCAEFFFHQMYYNISDIGAQKKIKILNYSSLKSRLKLIYACPRVDMLSRAHDLFIFVNDSDLLHIPRTSVKGACMVLVAQES
jgi:hypothetical protein